MGGHEIDRFGRGPLRGDEQIAFVLAVGVVDQNHHAALAHLGQHLLDDVFAGLVVAHVRNRGNPLYARVTSRMNSARVLSR